MSPEAKKSKPNFIKPSHLQVYAEVYAAEVLGKAGVSPDDVNRITKAVLKDQDGKTQQSFAQAVNQVSGGVIFREKP